MLVKNIPLFWEWLKEQGMDLDFIEENPDLEEYWLQQYEILFNIKTPEDYQV